jgi:hypothetical protein
MSYVVATLALVVACQLWLLWRIWRTVSALDDVTDECVRVSRTLHLLTETTETGFASFAGALTEAMQPAKRRKPSTRVRAMAARATGEALPPPAVVSKPAQTVRPWLEAALQREA